MKASYGNCITGRCENSKLALTNDAESRDEQRTKAVENNCATSSSSDGVNLKSFSGIRSAFDSLTFDSPPLRKNGVELIPGFKMVLGDLHGSCDFPTVDGRSYCEMISAGFEHTVHAHVFNTLISSLIHVPKNERQHLRVIDLGSNIGLFSLSSAALGYQVVSIEAQLLLNRFARASAWENGFSHRMTILDGLIVGNHQRSTHVLPKVLYVPGDNPTLMEDNSPNRTATERIPIAKVLMGTVQLLKIDIDGPEGPLMYGLIPLLKSVSVKNIVIEISTGAWKSFEGSFKEELNLFLSVFDLGYCVHFIPVFDQIKRHATLYEELSPSDDNMLPGYYIVPNKKKLEEVLSFENHETKNLFMSKEACL